MRRRTGALLAVLGLILVSCGGTQESSGDLNTAIAVHGDWTIEVYNADGSLDQRHEFSNALMPQGAAKLARVLGAVDEVDGWMVFLGVGEPGGGGGEAFRFYHATITVPPPGTAPGAKLTLIVPEALGDEPSNREIRWVQTRISAAGGASTNDAVTQTNLTPAIQVQALQTVHVTVEISFSD